MGYGSRRSLMHATRLIAVPAVVAFTGCTIWEALDNPWNGLGNGDGSLADVLGDGPSDASTSDGRSDGASSDGSGENPDSDGSPEPDACSLTDAGSTTIRIGDGGTTAQSIAMQGDNLVVLDTSGNVWACQDEACCAAMKPIWMESSASGPTSGTYSPVGDIAATDAGPYWTFNHGMSSGIRGPDTSVVVNGDASLNAIAVTGNQLAWTFGNDPSGTNEGISACTLPSCKPMSLVAPGGAISNLAIQGTTLGASVVWAGAVDGGLGVLVKQVTGGTGLELAAITIPQKPVFVGGDGWICWAHGSGFAGGLSCCNGCASGTGTMTANVAWTGSPAGVFVRNQGDAGLAVYAAKISGSTGELVYCTIENGSCGTTPVIPLDPLPLQTEGTGTVPEKVLAANASFAFYIDQKSKLERVAAPPP
jgi:hypothetical protein